MVLRKIPHHQQTYDTSQRGSQETRHHMSMIRNGSDERRIFLRLMVASLLVVSSLFLQSSFMRRFDAVAEDGATQAAPLAALDDTTTKRRLGEGVLGQDQANSFRIKQLQHDIATKRVKPRFVMHVGPMKTGTSSLQADLDWLFADDLAMDNWYYVRSHDPMETDVDPDDPELFLKQFKVEADKLLLLNKNVIRSREQYSVFFFYNPQMYEKLAEILSDWDVTIVGGYRPFHEWIPSFWYQAMRMQYSDPNHPEERALNKWRDENTGNLYETEPMFPNFYNFWKNKGRFSDTIVELASPHFANVRLFDIHHPSGARSHFLCDVLGQGAAPHSCQKSLQMTRDNPSKRVNPSNVKEVQYDSIALQAVAVGMVDETKYLRSQVVDAIVKRQEVELGLTVLDFPLICPDEAIMEEFLEMTLQRERLCLPEKVHDDPEQTRLRKHFQKAVDKKKYCRVDVEAVLSDSGWQQFFQEKFAIVQ